MSKKTFNLILENISIINLLSNEIRGIVTIDGKEIETIINKTNEYEIIVGVILNHESTGLFQLKFSNELFSLNIDTLINSRGNKVNITEKYFQSHSKEIIHSLKSKGFDTNYKSIYRAFYKISNSNFRYCYKMYDIFLHAEFRLKIYALINP